ncbi:hypothetical protein [Microseira wollei]|uniref:hypothetical protein n=1 Tax=Microseira wollei TaxID=467598 RepID=UPI001CFF105D|nr:hypothetical protein [Microseira wollei]
MPTPQNWKNYCGVGVRCRQDAYPTKLEKLLWGGGLVQAGCLPHKTGKIIVGWGFGAGRMPTPQNWKNYCGVGVGCRQDAYPTKLEKLFWGGGLVQAGCLPHKTGKIIVGWGSRLPKHRLTRTFCSREKREEQQGRTHFHYWEYGDPRDTNPG